MTEALRHDRPFALPKVETIADGLAARITDEVNLCIVRRYVDEVIQVTDAEILAGLIVFA